MRPPGLSPPQVRGWGRRLRSGTRRELVVWFAGPVLSILGVAAVAFEHGFREPLAQDWLWWLVQSVVLIAFGVVVLTLHEDRGRMSRWTTLTLSAVGLVSVVLEFLPAYQGAVYVAHACLVLLFCGEAWRINASLARTMHNPSLLFPLSFLVLIIIGTLLLHLPVSIEPGQSLSTLDAAFTMTSAVCVTGLTVKDTATEFTPFGQSIIAIFIQLGGLGVIIFGSTLALLFGRRLSSGDTLTLSEALDDLPAHRVASFVRFIVICTLVFELIGALVLMPLWQGDGLTTEHRIGLSVFHSISAFCNAGFDITGASMLPYRSSGLAHLVIVPLIVIGGIGFPVIHELGARSMHWWRGRRSGQVVAHRPLSLHARLVLMTTLVLYLGGVAIIFLSQITGGEPGSAWTHLTDAHFMSVSARTAGFNTLPMQELGPGSRFALMFLMLIGGSPGATAGGIKTVTLAVLVLSVMATIRQRDETEAFGRAIPDSIVRKTAAIAVCMLTLIGLATLALSMTEKARFEVIVFECVSAATTTGLSLGITSSLTPVGKVVIVVTMFLGRVGPLTLFAVLLRRAHVKRYQYPHEQVTLG